MAAALEKPRINGTQLKLLVSLKPHRVDSWQRVPKIAPVMPNIKTRKRHAVNSAFRFRDVRAYSRYFPHTYAKVGFDLSGLDMSLLIA
jgi:hypothetical protein